MKNSMLLMSLGLFSAMSYASMFPQHSKGEGIWQIEGQGLFAQQSNNLSQPYSVDFGIALPEVDNFAHNLAKIATPDPETHWGFGGRIGYVFPSHKYDIQLRYFGINMNNDSDSSVVLFPINDGDPFDYDSNPKYNFNSAELMFGNYYKPTKRLMLRTSYGIAFADIIQKSSTVLIGTNNPGNGDAIPDLKNSFIGAGPKAMIDADFAINKPFSIVGGVGLSLLYGEAELHNTITQEGSTDPTNNFVLNYEDSEDRVAAGFDAKLGLHYAQAMSDEANINLEIGYKLAAYLNALDDKNIEQIIPGGPTLLFEAESNYTYAGPYANIGIDFM